MNRLEIFQKVYGTDHVFTAQELERLRQVTELIVRECAAVANINSHQWQVPGDFVLEHFGVDQ